MKKTFVIIFVFAIIAFLGVWWQFGMQKQVVVVTNFEECAVSGSPIMESYPRQCRYEDRTFIEDIGNELEKYDIIRVSEPRPNTIISSPIVIKGEARGPWFFEASFPIELVDDKGATIASHYIMTAADWMTTDFVPFSGTLEFDLSEIQSKKARLILHKDNPSALPEHGDSLEIPVILHR